MPPRSIATQQPYLTVRSREDVDRHLALLRASAEHMREWIGAFSGDALGLLRSLKFDPVGRHPIDDRPLNVVEQINQTWTYAVALAAARKLLELHPESEGFKVAPGAHMALPLDIMSIEDGLVGAETFAAVDPRNNRKLALDLAKMAARKEQHRYVFFCSPKHPNEGVTELGRRPVQVWAVTRFKYTSCQSSWRPRLYRNRGRWPVMLPREHSAI